MTPSHLPIWRLTSPIAYALELQSHIGDAAWVDAYVDYQAAHSTGSLPALNFFQAVISKLDWECVFETCPAPLHMAEAYQFHVDGALARLNAKIQDTTVNSPEASQHWLKIREAFLGLNEEPSKP